MNLRNVLSKAIKFAGPVLGGVAVGGPVGGVVGAVSSAAGAITKSRSRARASESHQVTAPVGAVATGTLLGALLAAVGIANPDPLVSIACGGWAQAGALSGVLAALSHQVGHGVGKTARR